MAIPSQILTVLDPSLGLVEPAPNSPLYIGYSSLGDTGTIYSFSSPQTVRDTLGYGALAECVLRCLREAGGPVLAVRIDGDIAATKTVVTSSGLVTATLTGDAHFDSSVYIECTEAGALGTAKIRFTYNGILVGSLPDTVSVTIPWSNEYTTPADGIFALTALGLTITFDDTPGDFAVGDTFSFSCTAPAAGATDYSGVSSLLAALPVDTSLIFGADNYALAADSVAAFDAMAGLLQDLENVYSFNRGMVNTSLTATAATKTAFADTADVRVTPCYGACLIQSAAPYEGFSYLYTAPLIVAAARAVRTLISTDLARFAEGNLAGVTYIFHDANTDKTMDSAGFLTLRRWPNASGFYITNGRVKAPFGSDYQYIQYGRVMDRACRLAYEAMQPFMAEGFRTIASGAIDPLDAADVEDRGRSSLDVGLLQEPNARGTGGHVSEVFFDVNKTNNLATSGEVQTEIGLRPLGYARTIRQTLGFRLSNDT